MPPLERLTGFLRGQPRLEPAELERYGAAVRPLAEELGRLYLRWRDGLELDAPQDDLANSASIQRWEAAGLSERLAAVAPPAALARLHAELAALTLDTARAAQLLSNGLRFHSSRARCQGQALMLDAEARFATLRGNLARVGLSVELDDVAGDARAAR
jgi:hypothetical protein